MLFLVLKCCLRQKRKSLRQNAAEGSSEVVPGENKIVGYTTKKDLTSMGRMLFMALIGLVIATVVNMFMRSSGLDMILNYVGVLVFVGLTAYDTQKIKEQLMMAGDAGEAWQKMALVGALTLYLDFINLFLYLLRILGKRE